MTAREKVLQIRPQAYAHDTGKSIIIRDDAVKETIVICPVRRESWAWAAALRYLSGKE